MADLPCCPRCCRRAELRPYGPHGQMICFNCVTGSPELEAEAKRQFAAQLHAAGDIAVVGISAGPYPYQKEKRNG